MRYLLLLFIFLNISITLSQDITTGLVGYWPFCGNTNDASGNNLNGTRRGGNFTVDRFGNPNSAYQFDGRNDYIYVEDDKLFDDIEANDEITISAWIYIQNWFQGQNFSAIINKYRESDDNGWETFATPNGLTTILDGNGSRNCNFSFSLNQWYHIAATYSRTKSEFNQYVNGQLICSQTIDMDIMDTERGRFYIGYSPMKPDQYTDGVLDEIRIYNKALSSADISALYNFTGNSGIMTTLSKTVNFGTIFCQPDTTVQIELTNPGSSIVSVTRLSFSHRPTSYFSIIDRTNFSLNPGDTKQIAVKFTPRLPGIYYDTLLIENGNCSAPLKIYLEGRCESVSYSINNAIVDTTFIKFNLLCPGTSNELPVQIQNNSTIPITLNLSDFNQYFTLSQSGNIRLGINEIKTLNIKFIGSSFKGKYYQLISVTDSCGRQRYIAVNAEVYQPIALAGKDTAICYGSIARLGTDTTAKDPSLKFSWSPVYSVDDPNIARPVTKPLYLSTEFILTVIDKNGCMSYDTVFIKVNPQLNTKMQRDTMICNGSSIILNANVSGGQPPFAYNWSPTQSINNFIIANPIAIPTKSTKYFVTITDGAGCSITDSITVVVTPKLEIDAGKDLVICSDSIVNLNLTVKGSSSSFRAYRWSPSSGLSNASILNPTLRISLPGKYKYIISVTDDYNCPSFDTLNVTVRSNPNLVFDKLILDFGILDACTSIKFDSIIIKNNESETITFDKTDKISGLQIIYPKLPFSILPGEKKTVVVSFSPISDGNFSGDLGLYGSPCSWFDKITYRGSKDKILLNTSLPEIDFGISAACNQLSVDTSFTITNFGLEDITLSPDTSYLTEPFRLIEPIKDIIIKKSDSIKVKLNFTPSNFNDFSQILKIPYTSQSCTDTLRLFVKGSYFEPELITSTKRLDIDYLSNCEDYKDTILTFTNSSKITIRLDSISKGSNYTILDNFPIEFTTGQSSNIRLRFTPINGNQISEKLIYYFSPCDKSDSIIITGGKNGISFKTPELIDFGDITYCNSAIQTKIDSIQSIGNLGSESKIVSVSIDSKYYITNLKSGDLIDKTGVLTFNVSYIPDNLIGNQDITAKLKIVLSPCNTEKEINLKVRNHIVNLSGIKDLNFGNVSNKSSKTLEMNILNESDIPANIKRIFTNHSDTLFTISTLPLLPATLKPNETLKISLDLNIKNLNHINDSLFIDLDSPCSQLYRVSLKGDRVIKVQIRIPDTVGNIGSNMCIPISAINENNDILTEPFDFDAELLIDASSFSPTNESSLVDTKNRSIKLSGKNVSFLSNQIKLSDLCGLVMLSDLTPIPIKINYFNSTNPLYEFEKINGSISTTGVCARNLSQIKLLESDKMEIQSNSSGESLKINYTVNRKKRVKISMYNSLGSEQIELLNKVAEEGQSEILIDTDAKSIISGVYFIKMITEDSNISQKFVIIK